MDVGLHHRGIDTHLASLDHTLFLGDGHHSLVNLRDHLRSQRHAPAAHCLGIGHLAAAHAGKVAVHQVGPHLAFQLLVTPVADMFEGQQPQHHVGRRAASAAATAVGMALPQCVVDDRDNLLIGQHFVGVFHPVFAKIAHFLRDQPIPETELPSPHLNHAACSAALTQPVAGAADHG